MTLKSIFKEPIDRPIEGVIKADDEESLRLEVEEYVLTNEVEKRLESFLEAYTNYDGSNGVWISGFFGSGKSHLLKMLALLLEDRRIDGMSSLDQFLPKCGDNEILRGDLKRAVAIPSKSILFNIDQKAEVISKTQIDALLAVFVKVFDEMCGYYGKQGHIAQFERDLDTRGVYEQFKTAYEDVAGRSWFRGREQALLESKNIAKAYAQVNGGDESEAVGILDKYRSQYHVSIEDFAEQVKAYVDSQSPDFRLNFFVDEVGQYIADHLKLMTNLQTIAESLATKCRGRAWLIVTAQEDMNTVLGELGKQQSNDFTKIQARFHSRMKLTSADVAEVIQKRLLTKNEKGIDLLSTVYHSEANNFKTLFDFADGAPTYRNFQDLEHFIQSYPFIPYQFALFQSAIQSLSQHNAFEGKHSSVGERSMLGVFQLVGLQIAEQQVGRLATFDLMFEGIRAALKSNIQRAVLQAEKHLDSSLAVRVLKTLFLIKYVKEFKPTVRNVCVLMLEGFHTDMPQLRKDVEAALNLLEQQTAIQRNGEWYEYLTDEEKDVEQEIKNTEVESTDIAAELVKLIFDHVIKNRKIRYEENGQDYPYSRKLDDRLYGREYELAIHVISPFHEHAGKASVLQMQSVGRDELLVLIPPDDRLMRDLLMYKRTEKYVSQNHSITQQEAVKRILTDKSFQNRERYEELKQRLRDLLIKAKLFVAGNEIEATSQEAQIRINQGFQDLITRVYPNLRMLRGMKYSENDIGRCLKPSQMDQLGSQPGSLTEPEQEMLAFIQGTNREGVRTSVKKLLEKFERKSYGWPYAAVLCTLAKLCASGKVEVRSDSNLLEGESLEQALRNSQAHANVLLEPQLEFTASQVRFLKEFYEEFFDLPAKATEAKALGQETGAALRELVKQLRPLVSQSSQYPFLETLKPVIEQLVDISDKPYSWYLKELPSQAEQLLDLKEERIAPIRSSMSGPQKRIFDSAGDFIQKHEANLSYLEGDEGSRLIGLLSDPECFKGNAVQQIKALEESLQEKVTVRIHAEVAEAKATFVRLRERLSSTEEFSLLSQEQQEELLARFHACEKTVACQSLIAKIRDTMRCFEEHDYPKHLADLSEQVQKGKHTGNGVDDQTSFCHLTLFHSLKPSFEKAWLVDETDVDRYLESLRDMLLAEIQNGNRIQI